MDIISTFHHGFAGGSKNTSRLLHYIAKEGCNVDGYFFEKPQFFNYTESKVRAHILDEFKIHSEVIDSNLLKNFLASERIVDKIKKTKDPILIGANLFPYCDILLDAKIQARQLLKSEPRLVIHPVGSDVWQLGPKLSSRIKFLLDHPLVDKVVTYSEKFILEIKEYFDINREIHVLPPVLEKEKFYSLSEEEISERKGRLRLNDDFFTIHHHSSMRKIKCPEIVIEIAKRASQKISRKCVLIMAGPIPYENLAALNLSLTSMIDSGPFLYKIELKNLAIYFTGIISNVEYLLQISDVELNASLHDSFNIALMEAMACGIPVVSSDIVGITGHIKMAQGGYCFSTKKLRFDFLNEVLESNKPKNDLFDIDSAVKAIVSISDNKCASKLKGNTASKYVASEFSIEKISKNFYKYIS